MHLNPQHAIGLVSKITRGNAWTDAFDTPPNPITNYSGYISFRNKRRSQFYNKCPLIRSITYYIAPETGSDANDGLSPGTAWKTIPKAQAAQDALGVSGNAAFLWKSGETAVELQEFAVTKPNVSVGTYGGSSPAKFDAATLRYLSSGWTLAAGNRYTRAETTDVAWVLHKDDWDTTLFFGRPLARRASSAEVDAESYTYYWAANVLHINLGGTNPNTLDLVAIPSNSINGISGINDSWRVDNIWTRGHGCHRTSTANQKMGIQYYGYDTMVGLVSNCGSYYNSSHNIAFYANSGNPANGAGHFLSDNNRVGWTKYNSSGETQLNSYSALGNDESWVMDWFSVGGTLPSSDWNYVNLRKRGRPTYHHTTGGTNYSALYVNDTGSMATGLFQCAQTPNAFDVIPALVQADVRCYLNKVQKPVTSYSGTEEIAIMRNAFMTNYAYYPKPATTTTFLEPNIPTTSFHCNGIMIVDAGDYTGVQSAAWWNAPPSSDNLHNFAFGLYKFINIQFNSSYYAQDYDALFDGNTAPSGTAQSRNCTANNCLYGMAGPGSTGGTGKRQVGINNDASKMDSNGYYRITQVAGKVPGYDNDAHAVILTNEPMVDVSDNQILGKANTRVTRSHDKNGKPVSLPDDLGPTNYSGFASPIDDSLPVW